MKSLITARGITKHFGATKALDGVDLDINAGEVHVLLGSRAVEEAVKAAKGEAVQEVVDVEVKVITKQNVAEFIK